METVDFSRNNIEEVNTSSSDFEWLIELIKQSDLNNVSTVKLWLLKQISDWAFVLKDDQRILAWMTIASDTKARLQLYWASISNILDSTRRETHEQLTKSHRYIWYETEIEDEWWEKIIELINGISENIYFILHDKSLEEKLNHDKYEKVRKLDWNYLESIDGTWRTYYKTITKLNIDD